MGHVKVIQSGNYLEIYQYEKSISPKVSYKRPPRPRQRDKRLRYARLDPVFSTMVSYYHGAIETLPYLAIGFEMFLYLLGFELAMLFLKLFLGSRTPMHSSN